MAYTNVNYQSKKDLKAAVAAGVKVGCHNPGLGPDLREYTGKVFLEGPHYPKPHRWYAEAELVNGVITKVK
jgi:hypothetical protein